MKTLSDIPMTPVQNLMKLAAAYVPEEKETPAPSKPSARASGGAAPMNQNTLGPVDIGKYLTHYGLGFTVKAEGGRTLYLLNQCLFNPEHGKDEASIIQDGTGRMSYYCFHNSCKGHTWRDARSAISGDDSLAQFCEGFDPNFKPGKSKKNSFKKPPKKPPVAGEKTPDADEFFDGRTFIPQYLAHYLQGEFDPILFDGSDLYRYSTTGVWLKTEPQALGQVAEKVLYPRAKTAHINDAIGLIQHRVYVPPDEFKHNPDFLNLTTGMLEIETMEMFPHAPEYHSRIQLPVGFDINAKAPRWAKFLEEIFPGEEGKQKAICLQSFFGYCLLPDCRFQKCLFCIGGGANGKSVVTDVLVGVIGEQNVASLPLQLFGHRFLIGQLNNKLVNVAGEVDTSNPIDTANFKDAVSGGLLMADEKHGKPFGFYNVSKQIFSMNDVPKISDKSHGFQRRPIVLQFTERFEEDRRDPLLTQKLLAERDGIFQWMLEGLQMILHFGGLIVPEVVAADGQEFIKSVNPVLLFVEDCCDFGEHRAVKPPELYVEYANWCTEGKNRPLSRNKFYQQILVHFPEVKKKQMGSDRARYFVGMGLKKTYP